jgi:hypothetical protein
MEDSTFPRPHGVLRAEAQRANQEPTTYVMGPFDEPLNDENRLALCDFINGCERALRGPGDGYIVTRFDETDEQPSRILVRAQFYPTPKVS